MDNVWPFWPTYIVRWHIWFNSHTVIGPWLLVLHTNTAISLLRPTIQMARSSTMQHSASVVGMYNGGRMGSQDVRVLPRRNFEGVDGGGEGGGGGDGGDAGFLVLCAGLVYHPANVCWT